MSCDHDWFNATKIGDPKPVDVCRLCGARSDDPAVAFQRAWDYSINDQRALDALARGGVWRVYEQPSTPLRPMSREEMEQPIETKIIVLRCQRIGNLDPLWVIQARYEGEPGDWTEVTTGKMVW